MHKAVETSTQLDETLRHYKVQTIEVDEILGVIDPQNELCIPAAMLTVEL